MAEQKETTAVIHNIPKDRADSTVTLRVPKPNVQVVILGLVAFITLFQTFQLIRISNANTGGAVKSAPAANTGSGTGGSGTNANAPQSMVGGC